MHANILKYQHALKAHGRRRELNRILLLTPNEGLSRQHLREFEAAGIDAELFNKEGRGLFSGQAVEILEVTRLRDEMGDRTIAIDAFEGNNLVLVDEGHRGMTAGEEGAFMRFRNALCEKGFSFEYSATFGQAVKGRPKLIDLYARSTLFDYSYRYFYGDGFGKDYQILNLDEGTQQKHLELYLVACLLSFFQQQRLYREQGATFQPFHIEKPLWIEPAPGRGREDESGCRARILHPEASQPPLVRDRWGDETDEKSCRRRSLRRGPSPPPRWRPDTGPGTTTVGRLEPERP